MITLLLMTLTPLQINLIITFAQSALTWQIYTIYGRVSHILATSQENKLQSNSDRIFVTD